MGTVAELVRDRIAAEEAYAAIEYGRRALDARDDRYGRYRYVSVYDRTVVSGAWMAAQIESGVIEAAIAIGRDDLDERDWTVGATWLLNRGKKVAAERVKAAKAAVKAAGTQNQLRLAIAMAA